MGCCRCCCILLITIGLIIAGSLGLLTALFPYPSHASCQVEWQFGKYCSEVRTTLVNQIEDWSHESCNTKQQCRYDYLGGDDKVINARHTTPLTKYTDTLNFTMTDNTIGCQVKGFSTSDAWYAVIDFGVNYCNLKNLIIGSLLYKGDDAYTEKSNNSICTMYSLAHCNLYD